MKIVTNGLNKMRCFPSWDFLPFRIVSTEMHRVCLDVASVEEGNGSGSHLLMQLLLLSAVRHACLLFTQTNRRRWLNVDSQ